MEDEIDSLAVHPPGDLEWLGKGRSEPARLDTDGGRFQVEWDPSAKAVVKFNTVAVGCGWMRMRPGLR